MTESKPLASWKDNSEHFKKKASEESANPGISQPEPVKTESQPETGTKGPWDFESIMEHLEDIPQVCGYRLMLIPVSLGDVTKGGIALPDSFKDSQMLHAQVFRVVGMGPEAYQDETRFPSGPYCQLGDFVMIGRYAGTKVTTMYVDELRIVNDDEIQAKVPDLDNTLDIV